MEIQKILHKERKLYLKLIGDFTIKSVAKIKEDLEKFFLEDCDFFVLDLSEVREFDSLGLQLLLALKLHLNKSGKKLKLVHHPISVIKYLDLYGLIGFFGDKIKISKEIRQNLLLAYGLKKEEYGFKPN